MRSFEGNARRRPRRKGPQATLRQEEPADPSRRRVLERLVGGAALAASASLGLKIFGQEAQQPPSGLKERPPVRQDAALPSPASPLVPEVSPVPEEPSPEVRDALAPYTFLTYTPHPHAISMGELAGKKLSALYAAYLGLPDDTPAETVQAIPETLSLDFKENLADLWRKKFHFDSPHSTPEDERAYREHFLKNHPRLMNLAESLWRSYDPPHTHKMSLDDYIRTRIEPAVEKSHKAFMGAMYALRTDRHFYEKQRLLIEKIANRVNAQTLLSCALTELMPSQDGELNRQMMDFLCRNAGVDFINRIPSVHDMLPSFGPYQITPALFAPGGSGFLAEKMEEYLPRGLMPSSVEDVEGSEQHVVAYITAMEHIVQFVGTLHPREVAHAQDVFDHTALPLLHEEVTAFVAASHHRPAAAYEAFKSFILHSRVPTSNTRPLARLIDHIEEIDLRKYTRKALANYRAVSAPEMLAQARGDVS